MVPFAGSFGPARPWLLRPFMQVGRRRWSGLCSLQACVLSSVGCAVCQLVSSGELGQSCLPHRLPFSPATRQSFSAKENRIHFRPPWPRPPRYLPCGQLRPVSPASCGQASRTWWRGEVCASLSSLSVAWFVCEPGTCSVERPTGHLRSRSLWWPRSRPGRLCSLAARCCPPHATRWGALQPSWPPTGSAFLTPMDHCLA